MKQFKECARLHSLNQQIFAHVWLVGFLLMIFLIIAIGTISAEAESPVFFLFPIGTFTVVILGLLSSNRITYLDERKSTLEIRWFLAYRFCYRSQRILLNDVNQLTLLTNTDFEGDKTYQLNIEVVAKDQGLIKHTPDEIMIIFDHSLDPILKSGEKLGKLFRKKLVRAEK